jgi:3,4-dihydroxy 2-butanone 4-phosphate synthase/GTP cyclohydrolase II
MNLADWIKESGMSRTAVANAVGVTPAYVTNLCSPEPHWPGRAVIIRLRALTGGAVTAEDFLPSLRYEAAKPEQTI